MYKNVFLSFHCFFLFERLENLKKSGLAMDIKSFDAAIQSVLKTQENSNVNEEDQDF